MKQVADYNEVLDAMSEVKRHGKVFCTNFFPMPTKVKGWIANRNLRVGRYPGVRVFMRTAASFDYLYFFAEERARLGTVLLDVAPIVPRVLVAELIGRKPDLDEMQLIFTISGFRHYKTLQRMVRVSRPEDSAVSTQSVETATEADAVSILELLNQTFDLYADSIPDATELHEALTKGCIHCIHRDGNIAAMVFLELAGQTATLRYWAVGSRYRNLGLGAIVMRHALRIAAPRRMTLWVVSINDSAISKYAHYGFAMDSMEDRIMILDKV